MKSDRIAIYARASKRGFTHIDRAVRLHPSKMHGLPKSHYPRAPKDGEHLIRVAVDPNYVQHDRGDVILNLHIESKALPGLRGDWEVVQARPMWTTRHDGGIGGWFRYLLVRPAESADVAKCQAAAEESRRRVMNRMMTS